MKSENEKAQTNPDQALPETEAARHNIRLPGFLIDSPVGLGDVIKKVTYAAGIPACDGCERRAEKLNRWIRFTP